ncbi:beta-N-acetylhexosaminidase [Streptomyces sp. 1114.5]|uniref:glycoside hydrolase family 3 protein n=1 Tax=unclassified Streptomyces TaxID=2593676 RepID=UPI000BCB7DF9|nr:MULTISPECIES: glycoside hydrolase family 3 protein [unclassified Streptomyces]RKT15970.1 beta-N-acetylhexosaminidase [Streptomyces sp. 1114.5]SOB82144.1 beta-N-acetylhexosaminidase [Streptomyces sp. 1331.2]
MSILVPTVPDSDQLHRDALTVLQPGFVGTEPPPWVLRHLAAGLGSVALFDRNVVDLDQLSALTRALRAENPDLLIAIDEESGDVTRLEAGSGSSWPGNLALGAIDDPALTRDVARELGRALAAAGVNYNWAPTADVNSNPRNPVIGVRSFGADPELCARHTAAWVEGLQSAGVAACSKHFPGHGDTAVDSHHGLPVIDVDLDVLRARDLIPFQAAIAAGTKAVMTAHIMIPALDPKLPATLSPTVLRDLLRAAPADGGLGYQGLIVSDAIEMGAIADTFGMGEGTVLALAAGADAICVGGGLADEETVLMLRDAIVAGVRAGRLDEERLADAAARVRTLGSWGRISAQGERPEPDLAVGLRAARRALRVVRAPGRVAPPVSERPYVASFSDEPNIAVGDVTPWGVAGMLADRFPGTRTREVSAAEATPELLDALVGELVAEAEGRRLVLVVRDAHRYAWMSAVLSRLVAARPDAAVVEMGLPQSEPVGALHIATHGAARVCGLAAVEVLTGQYGAIA